jgi:GNAT superfamily N-acetyltransferase
MRVVDVEPGDPALIRDLLPVLLELRPHLTAESYLAVYEAGHPQGLRFSAAYDDSERCVGVAGWRVVETTNVIKKLYVDDLVTTELARSTGVGAALLAHCEAAARAAGCQVLDLDSAVHRFDAHRFYFRERMYISGYHFWKPLT